MAGLVPAIHGRRPSVPREQASIPVRMDRRDRPGDDGVVVGTVSRSASVAACRARLVPSLIVMAGLVPAIHGRRASVPRERRRRFRCVWIAGTGPAMTVFVCGG